MLTAGHCVYDIHSTHRMVSSLNFAPGMDGHGKPYGVMQWQNVRILSQFQAQVCSLGPKLREHPASSCRCMRTLPYGKTQHAGLRTESPGQGAFPCCCSCTCFESDGHVAYMKCK